MKRSVQDETLFAVGDIANESKPKRGRPRIHADDAARKRAYNQRRAQAYARTRAAEQRAKRWEAKARDLREQLDLAHARLRRTEETHASQRARLRAHTQRLQGQLSAQYKRKDELAESSRQAVAEAKQLRDRLARAERAVSAYGADDRLDKLELKAKVDYLEKSLMKALRENADLRQRLDRWREKQGAR